MEKLNKPPTVIPVQTGIQAFQRKQVPRIREEDMYSMFPYFCFPLCPLSFFLRVLCVNAFVFY